MRVNLLASRRTRAPPRFVSIGTRSLRHPSASPHVTLSLPNNCCDLRRSAWQLGLVGRMQLVHLTAPRESMSHPTTLTVFAFSLMAWMGATQPHLPFPQAQTGIGRRPARCAHQYRGALFKATQLFTAYTESNPDGGATTCSGLSSWK